jgi:PKD repeat protein
MYYYSIGTAAGMNPNTIIEGNTYQRSGGTFANIDNISYSTLGAFQAGIKKGMTDITMTVPYKSSTDLHLDQNSIAPYARALAAVTTDIDGDARKCSLFVTAGADESNYSGNLHLQTPNAPKFTGPSTGIDGVPLSFVNGGTVGPYVYRWYVDGVLQKDSTHLKVAMTTGTHKVQLSAVNCGGKDSSILTVVIKDPASTPVSDFISDVNIISAEDTVKFSDGSTGDPSKWTWTVSPNTALDANNNVVASYKVVYGSLNSSDPWIQFPYGGKYKICLTTSNKKGTGTTECKSAYIEVKPVYNMGKVGTMNDTSGTFYDDGGKNGQPLRAGKTTMLIDPCASDVYLTFSKFDMMCGYNYIRIYDGDKEVPGKELHPCTTNTTGYKSTGLTGTMAGQTPVWNSCYTTSARCEPKITDTFHAKSGRMLIVQDLNQPYLNYNNGFEAHYTSKPMAMVKPTAKFSSPDSICTNGILSFKNLSSGPNVKYFWDLDGDLESIESTSDQNPSYPFFTDGQVTVSLIAMNCGGSDTFQKTITVFNPATPSTAFVADNTNPTLNDVVFISTDMKECVDDYKWTIISASGKGVASFVNGTKSTSANVQVMFSDTGCYSVELYTANSSGDDNLKLNCYIKVKNPYCVPSAATMSSDLGISKVTFNTISNSSDQGKTGYSNYAPVPAQATTVEIGVTYKLTVQRATNKNKATRVVWIDWNGDGDFNDSGEKIDEEKSAQTLSWSTDITIPSTAKTGATIMRISVDLGTQSPTPCGPNKFGEFEDYRLYIRPDLTKPVITLVGSDTVVIEQGQTYADSGATAMDNLDGDISLQIVTTPPTSGFNLIPGIYTYKYNVTDAAQNDAVTVKRIVVVKPDVTAPSLTVIKPDTIMLQVFSPFVPPAVLSANDLVDGDLSGAVQIVNGVNANAVGDYTVTYTVSDVSKNKSTVIRYVKVVDTIMPTLTLVGGSTVFHEVGNTYTDSGVVVKDNYYSETDLRNNLTITDNIDVNTPGTYTVVYVLKDPFTGRTVSISRTVEVRDRQKPTVALNGNVTDVIDVFTTYNDMGVTASDNNDNNPSVTITGSYYTAFPDGQATILGTYTIVYTVTDASGNTVATSRTVKVVDRVAPTATLIGSGYVSVCRWAAYTDEGVNAKDNYDSTSKLTITKEGTFFFTETNVEGIYNFRYKIVDQSGNIGYSEYRNIYVRNPYQSPCTTATSVGEQIGLDKLVNVYPNPNQGKFTVEANIAATEQVRITVTNLLGQEVAVISNGALNTHTFQVDLSNQKAGVYMLNVTTSKQSITKRIVVTK